VPPKIAVVPAVVPTQFLIIIKDEFDTVARIDTQLEEA
jgi:hypothetical protein